MFALRQLSFVLACTALVLSSVSIDGVSAARRSLRKAATVGDEITINDIAFVPSPFASDSGSSDVDTSASSSFDGSYAGSSSFDGSMGSFDGSWGSFDGSYNYDGSWSGSEDSSSSVGEEIVIVFP